MICARVGHLIGLVDPTFTTQMRRMGLVYIFLHESLKFMGVSKHRGVYPPKWMVKIMENPIKMDDLGAPLFLETPLW